VTQLIFYYYYYNPCQNTLQLIAYLFILLKSSQALELCQHASTSQTYFSTAIHHRLQISPLHVCQLLFPTKYSNFIPLSSRILPILHLIFNHVTFLLISRFALLFLFLGKNSLNSYLSHPTLFVILINDHIPKTYILKQRLPILLPTIKDICILSLSPLVSFLNSSNSPRSCLFWNSTILSKKICSIIDLSPTFHLCQS